MTQILFELGTEELPPKSLNSLAESLYNGVIEELQKAEIGFNLSKSRWFASPRRLAFILDDIDEMQADKVIQRKGPAVIAAFDENGNPKPAAIGFAKSVGVEVSDLQTLKTDKGEWLVYDIKEKGKNITELLPDFIKNSIGKMPIPKPMRWGNNEFAFIRPVHWMVLLKNSEVIPFEMFSITASNQTRGHRFHFPDFITIDSSDSYVSQLESVRVYVDQESRKESIRQQVEKVATSLNGVAKIDEDLLQEVASIVEYPVAVAGSFEESFLQVPAEALISSMQKHQKYFPVFDNNNQLMPNFIALANIESKDVSQVIKGFEKVIRPRLADAGFFWEQDRKQPLQNRFEMLKKMTFEAQLGSLADKCDRVASILKYLSEKLELNQEDAVRVSTLLKCDLLTDMVGEFPDLQGIMGAYYAQSQGEKEDVCTAIRQQYKPAFSNDSIPTTALAQATAIADKMDTLCGIFAVGKKPSGNKDPFALRRATLGIIKIIQQGELNLNIFDLIEFCVRQVPVQNLNVDSIKAEVEDFVLQRLKNNYLEQGFSHDVVDAVLSLKPANLADISKRIAACAQFKEDSSSQALAEANKRISNILKKSDDSIPEKVTIRLLSEEQEKNLFGAIESIKRRYNQEVESQNYQDAFNFLTSLAEPVDKFFENVMVNSDDQEVRLNRLAILSELNQIFLAIADISKLEI